MNPARHVHLEPIPHSPWPLHSFGHEASATVTPNARTSARPRSIPNFQRQRCPSIKPFVSGFEAKKAASSVCANPVCLPAFAFLFVGEANPVCVCLCLALLGARQSQRQKANPLLSYFCLCLCFISPQESSCGHAPNALRASRGL